EISAINRPGPLALGLHNKWIDAHKGKATFTKEEKVISELLKNAFGESHTGLVIYQEDVMKIFQDGAGFSLGESDNIRRAMGKKNKDLMASFKERFIENWKYNEIISIDGLGSFAPDQNITLSNGNKIRAKDLYDRVQNGETFEVGD
ncbi:MAG: hypothetical protein GX982_03420, partial [Tissierellia bacterium]|nr:hypothetical protein [Tissierellia bacterium]